MHITILATGTRGDIQPYIPLGIELMKAGAQVRLATFENYKSFIESHGLDFYPIKGDVTKVASSNEVESSRNADNPLKLLFSFKELQSLVFEVQRDFYHACTGTDAVVYHPGAAIGYFAAQQLNIPSILATPFPMTPTTEYPSLIFYNQPRLGKQYNLLTHKIFEQIMWFASKSPINKFWRQEFGQAPKDFHCPYPKQTAKKSPTIISCSQYVFPRPKDWPEHVYNPGYWFLEDEAGWEPSSDLLDFLHSGPPPVYIGFGSTGDAGLAAQTTELVFHALKISGKRGILATGWGGMTKIESHPDDLFFLDSAPHNWLFPRMAAVVHHGGAGTTAAGLRAGIPSIVIPASNDQFAWGRRVYELGVGSKPISRKQLGAQKLAEALDTVSRREIIDAAEALGCKIRTETGAETAAKIIMECIHT